MNLEIILTLSLLAAIFAALALNLASADSVLFLALALLVIFGIVKPDEALSGFSNSGLIVVALLFIVSEALRNSGNLDFWAGKYLGTTRKGGLPRLLLKMMIPLTCISAFINNTPIVVIFTPVVKRWAEKIRVPASKFLIPLSYATVLGGTCTLIGTSTNLLAHGLLIDNDYPGFSMFELAWAGVPCAVAGLIYLAYFGGHLLPLRMDAKSHVTRNPKEYVIEMKVVPGSVLAGKTIRDAGLRNLKNIYLMDIEREGHSIGPVSGTMELKENDRLVFAGLPAGVLTLQELPGLVPAAHDLFEKDFAEMQTHFVEAVVSSNSPVLGKTVKECDFRRRYGAGVVAVHRNGERVQQKIGDIQLKAGDTLLLFTDPNFLETWKDSQDFYLISLLQEKPAVSSRRSWLTLGITLAMIVTAAVGESLPAFGLPEISILQAALAAVAALILTRSIQGRQIRQSLRWEILFVIAFSIGISKAIQASGTADWIASSLHAAAGNMSPTMILVLVYFTTVLITELLTNNAAVAVCFPIALAIAKEHGLDPRPFVIAITLAASNGYASPLGYQTHLIVQGPGGYKFGDYVKVGLPLDILVGVIAIIFIRLHWPF